jgi:uncharacterized protein
MFSRPTATLVLFLFGAGANPSIAESLTPSFNCAEGDSDVEAAICGDDRLAELDRELSRLYRLALQGPNITDARAEGLRQSERDWLQERRECWKSRMGLETCVANAYAFRIHALREGYADARGDDDAGISVGPLAYRCEGLDALVSAVFINGRTALVSLQWRERAMVLPRVPSGSGAKYESDLWDDARSLFWTQGDDAIFMPPGGAELSCKREPIG